MSLSIRSAAFLIAAVLALLPGMANAQAPTTGPYYVSPNGSPDNDGSAASPWPSVDFALAKVGGGKIIVLQPGFYHAGISIAKGYSGTPTLPTVIRAEAKWKAVILGSSEHGVYIADNANWIVIDGLEVSGARMDGIKISGDNDVVRNCWVHGSGSMGISAHGRKQYTIENCLVEFNGQNPQFHHGLYVDGQDFIVRNNIVRHNSGYGMQIYPSAKRSLVVNNVVYGHARKGAMYLQDKNAGDSKNVVVNNTLADNAYGITVSGTKGDLLANNIVTGPKPLQTSGSPQGLIFDYNLCTETCGSQQHGVVADPAFVNTYSGAYYLQSSSPAIGAGSKDYASAADFWGNPRNADAPVDLGAFRYLLYLTTSASRSTWYSGYAYRYSAVTSLAYGNPDMPDLWINPDPAAVPAP